MGKMTTFWLESLKARDNSEDKAVDGNVNDNKLDLREICSEDVAWTYLAQDGDQRRAVAATVMNLLVL
jgi:hypothetical protein